MKKERLIAGGAVALLAVLIVGMLAVLLGREPISRAQTATPDQLNTGGIAVQGSGTVLVKPDVVQLTVGVQSKAATVSETQKKSAETSKLLTDALKKAGIKETDIKTTNYSIYPEYQYDRDQPPKLRGYVVNNSLLITIRDTDKAGEIIDIAGTAGATQIGGISFTLENNADALKQARTAAMDDARQKADQLAAAGKIGVGSVIKVTEQYQNVAPPPVSQAAAAPGIAASASVPTVIESGQFRVIVNVQVTYSIK